MQMGGCPARYDIDQKVAVSFLRRDCPYAIATARDAGYPGGMSDLWGAARHSA